MHIWQYLSNFIQLAYFQIPYMTFAWLISLKTGNGSYVDLAWPSGFVVMTFQIFSNSKGYFPRKLLICLPYLVCGLRLIFGWIFARKHYKHEDKRWSLWRQKWKKSEGLLGIKHIPTNFFFFFHCQSIANIFSFSVPLILACSNKTEKLNIFEFIGFGLWALSFILENVADNQLTDFKKTSNEEKDKNGKVMKYGLWKYSRHPNYFFEWLIWSSYTLIALFSAYNNADYLFLSTVPLVAYYFLVYFTGVPMNEKACLESKGDEYAHYQSSTSMFFPWFPKNLDNKLN